jgi:uncharacterized membrane protein
VAPLMGRVAVRRSLNDDQRGVDAAKISDGVRVTTRSSPWRVAQARYRMALSLLVGLIGAGVAVALGGKELAPMIGWDVTVLTYIAWVWLTVWPMDAAATKDLAGREDPTQASTDALILTAAVASLAAVAVVLVLASSAHGAAKAALAALAIVSVAMSWLMLHTLFTLRYALMYYRDKPVGGIDFNQDQPPRYSDFAYLGFTLGMTFQVSDTDLQTTDIRATALRHALLSYLFGAIILATTINLIAGLSSGGG